MPVVAFGDVALAALAASGVAVPRRDSSWRREPVRVDGAFAEPGLRRAVSEALRLRRALGPRRR